MTTKVERAATARLETLAGTEQSERERLAFIDGRLPELASEIVEARIAGRGIADLLTERDELERERGVITDTLKAVESKAEDAEAELAAEDRRKKEAALSRADKGLENAEAGLISAIDGTLVPALEAFVAASRKVIDCRRALDTSIGGQWPGMLMALKYLRTRIGDALPRPYNRGWGVSNRDREQATESLTGAGVE